MGKRFIDKVVLHHSAGSTMDSAVNTMEKAGLHYHYLVDRDGTVFNMRDVNLIAYHAGALGNTASVGICFIGDFRYVFPSKMQFNEVTDIILQLQEEYGVLKIYNHNDFSSTLCPVVDLATQVTNMVITRNDEQDEQGKPEYTDDEIEDIERANKLGFIDEDIENFDKQNMYFIKTLLKAIDHTTVKYDEAISKSKEVKVSAGDTVKKKANDSKAKK